MIRIEKFKFENRFESLETKNLSLLVNKLQDEFTQVFD